MYRVYRNQGARTYLSLYFFFLSIQLPDIRKFSQTFLGNYEAEKLKFSIHMESGFMYYAYQNQVAGAYLSCYFSVYCIHPFFFRLSNFQLLFCFLCQIAL